MISDFYKGQLLQSELWIREDQHLLMIPAGTIQLYARASVRYSFLVNGTLQTSQTFQPPLSDFSRSAIYSFCQGLCIFNTMAIYICLLISFNYNYYHSITKKRLLAKKGIIQIAQIHLSCDGQLRCLTLHRCLCLLCVPHCILCLAHRHAGHCISDS